MQNETSRRAVIATLAALPAAGLVAAVPSAATASVNGNEWYALKAEYEAAKETLETYDRDIYYPADDAFCAARPDQPPLIMRLRDPKDGREVSSEVTRRYVETTTVIETLPNTMLAKEVRRLRELLAAHSAECGRLKEHYRIDEIEAEHNRLYDVRRELEQRLLAMPSPDPAALGIKIEILFADQTEEAYSDTIDMELIRPVVEDARRLLSSERG